MVIYIYHNFFQATLLTIGLVCIILNVVLLNLSTNLLMKLAAAAVNFGTGFWAGGFVSWIPCIMLLVE